MMTRAPMQVMAVCVSILGAAMGQEPDYTKYCSAGIYHWDDVPTNCHPVKPPSNLPAEFKAVNDTREVLTFKRTLDHTCKYDRGYPDHVGCDDIPTDTKFTVDVTLCGGFCKPDFAITFFSSASWCSEDGTKIYKQYYVGAPYGPNGCVKPIGTCSECVSPYLLPPKVIDVSPPKNQPRCSVSGKCSTVMPPFVCESNHQGCPCDLKTCEGCCVSHGGSAQHMVPQLTGHAIRERNFHCRNGTCVHSKSGSGVPGLDTCFSACEAPRPVTTPKYECVDNACYPATTGIDLEGCQALCRPA